MSGVRRSDLCDESERIVKVRGALKPMSVRQFVRLLVNGLGVSGRWAKRNWVLCILIPYSAILFDKLFEDTGPFPHWISFWSVEYLDRQQLGYKEVPFHYGTPPIYYTPWSSYQTRSSQLAYSTWDDPYWADPKTYEMEHPPLPALVRRTTIHAINPDIPCWIWLGGWMFWVAPRSHGFVRWMIPREPMAPGLCTACGYDLTANTSGVCPECGTIVSGGRRTHVPAPRDPGAGDK
jgi:hypothetical protein